MILEEIELYDWKIKPCTTPEERKHKSVQAYYLNAWYDDVKDITFKTYIYDNLENIPNDLPFQQSIVRYENKSPKDSEFWSHISTKNQLCNLFYTSLRCKTNKGKYYCVREFKELGQEYRCFWSNGIVAISSESEIKPNFYEIINYINSIKKYIKYHRCVFDIAELKNVTTEKYIFLEFNSWETNSGAHRFNWNIDTEIFYSTEKYKCVSNNTNFIDKYTCLYFPKYLTARWLNGEVLVENTDKQIYVVNNYCDIITPKELFDTYKIVEDVNYLNTLFTETHFYCSNDIWLGKFERDTLKCVDSCRGIFRFDPINFCEDNKIYDGENYYYDDLSPFKCSQYSKKPKINFRNNFNTEIKYGFILENKKNKQRCYLRLLSNFKFMLETEKIKFLIDVKE